MIGGDTIINVLRPFCISDDELRNVRDLDMFEMQRRGMTRWRAQ